MQLTQKLSRIASVRSWRSEANLIKQTINHFGSSLEGSSGVVGRPKRHLLSLEVTFVYICGFSMVGGWIEI